MCNCCGKSECQGGGLTDRQKIVFAALIRLALRAHHDEWLCEPTEESINLMHSELMDLEGDN